MNYGRIQHVCISQSISHYIGYHYDNMWVCKWHMVVLGMRLIRRPWKGCQFWDVPCTIPWKGCKFQKWGLRKWGYRICFFWVFNMLHMLSYDHQGGWGWGGVLTSLTSTSFTLRKMQTLHMLSVLSKIIPTKRFKLAQVNHKQNIFTKTKTYHFRGRLRDKSYRTIVAGTQQTDGTWKHLKTWRPPSILHEKNQNVYKKKVHLGLQLDMASQRCRVADCGFCVATSTLALLASRRGKNWKSECRPDMIRMMENHKFLMCFFWPLKGKIESPRGRNANFHSWVTRLPIEMNVHVANIFWRLLHIPAFCLLASKIRISNSSPLQGRRVNR